MSSEINNADELSRIDFGEFEFTKGYKAARRNRKAERWGIYLPLIGFAIWKYFDMLAIRQGVTGEPVIGIIYQVILIAVSCLLTVLFIRWINSWTSVHYLLIFREGIFVSKQKPSKIERTIFFENGCLQPWERIVKVTRYPEPASGILIEGPMLNFISISSLFEKHLDDILNNIREYSTSGSYELNDLGQSKDMTTSFGYPRMQRPVWFWPLSSLPLIFLIGPYIIEPFFDVPLFEPYNFVAGPLAFWILESISSRYAKDTSRYDVGEQGILAFNTMGTVVFRRWDDIVEIKPDGPGRYKILLAGSMGDTVSIEIPRQQSRDFEETVEKYQFGRSEIVAEPSRPGVR